MCSKHNVNSNRHTKNQKFSNNSLNSTSFVNYPKDSKRQDGERQGKNGKNGKWSSYTFLLHSFLNVFSMFCSACMKYVRKANLNQKLKTEMRWTTMTRIIKIHVLDKMVALKMASCDRIGRLNAAWFVHHMCVLSSAWLPGTVSTLLLDIIVTLRTVCAKNSRKATLYNRIY